MKTLLILICVCLMCVVIVTGQDKRADSTGQSVERKYDRFKDQTTVKLKPQRIIDSKSPRHVLEMSAEVTFKGEQPTQWDEMVQIVFISSAEKNPYREPVELNFIVDGQRVKGATSRVGSPYNPRSPLADDMKVAYDIVAFVSLDSMRKVANGKKVEMQLGPTELILDTMTIDNLRKFSAAIQNK
jgi:hypothetical protein